MAELQEAPYSIKTDITERADVQGRLEHNPDEEAEIKAREAQPEFVLSAQHLAEAEEAKMLMEANRSKLIADDDGIKAIDRSCIDDVHTSSLARYVEQELSDLAEDIVVYNVLPCEEGAIMGDAREITEQLERTYTASMSDLSLAIEPPSFYSQLNQLTQVVSNHRQT